MDATHDVLHKHSNKTSFLIYFMQHPVSSRRGLGGVDIL